MRVGGTGPGSVEPEDSSAVLVGGGSETNADIAEALDGPVAFSDGIATAASDGPESVADVAADEMRAGHDSTVVAPSDGVATAADDVAPPPGIAATPGAGIVVEPPATMSYTDSNTLPAESITGTGTSTEREPVPEQAGAWSAARAVIITMVFIPLVAMVILGSWVRFVLKSDAGKCRRPTSLCDLCTIPCPRSEFGRCLCQWAWRYIFLVIYVCMIITIVMGLGVREGGAVPLTMLLVSPALVGFLLGAIPPTTSRFATVFLLLFVVYMSFFRGYLMRCEHAWEKKCETEPMLLDNGMTVGCSANFTTQVALFDYCADSRTVNPVFWLLGDNASSPAWCTVFPNYNLCRQTCWPMTCYFAQGGSPDFQIKPYTLWMFLVIFALITLVWWTNCCPLCSCCMFCAEKGCLVGPCVLVCGSGNPPADLVRMQHEVDKVTECGKLPIWLRWVWAAFLPFWLCMYVTYVQGGIKKLMPNIALDWGIFSVLISDAKNLAVSLMVVIVVLLLYIQRKQVYVALGIDDRYVLHWQHLFGSMSTPPNEKVLQICIWKVKTSYKKEKLQTDTEDDDEEDAGRGTLWNCSRAMMKTGKASRDEMRLDLNEDCSVFLRIAYGHNEPLCGRVVRVKAAYNVSTSINFQESFRLNKQEADSESEEPPLYIELQQQEVATRHDLGRVTFEPARLRTVLESNDSDTAKKQLRLMMDLEDGEAERKKEEDGEEYRTTLLPSNPKYERRKKMKDAKFMEEPLSHGGAVWIGIAELEVDCND